MSAEEKIAELEALLSAEQAKCRALMFERTILSLLHCAKHNNDWVLSTLSEYGVRFSGDRFVVLELARQPLAATFRLDPEAQRRSLAEAYDLARSFLDTQLGNRYTLLHTREADVCYCIINGSGDQFLQDIRNCAEALVEKLEHESLLNANANISDETASLSDMEQVMKSLEQIGSYRRFLLDDTPCLVYADISYRITDRNGGQAPEKQLILAINTAQFEDARDRLSEFFHYLFVENRPGAVDLSSQYYRLINPLLDVLSDLLDDLAPTDPAAVRLSSCRQALLNVRCIADLRSAASATLDALEAHHTSRQAGDDPRWLPQLEQLIRQEYRDPQLSISMLAEQIGLSSVHMSRVYRQCRGQSILDHVHQLRIRTATELLQSGDSVKHVSAAVGYATPLSMTRAFKKYEGCTPGSYLPGNS